MFVKKSWASVGKSNYWCHSFGTPLNDEECQGKLEVFCAPALRFPYPVRIKSVTALRCPVRVGPTTPIRINSGSLVVWGKAFG